MVKHLPFELSTVPYSRQLKRHRTTYAHALKEKEGVEKTQT